MELVFSTCAVPGEGRARERELGRWRHYKDKCTLLIRQQHYTGLRQTPQVARATLGAGGLIHIETQAEVSLILLMGQQGDNPWKEGRGLGSRLALSQIQHFLQGTRSASEGTGNGV